MHFDPTSFPVLLVFVLSVIVHETVHGMVAMALVLLLISIPATAPLLFHGPLRVAVRACLGLFVAPAVEGL